MAETTRVKLRHEGEFVLLHREMGQVYLRNAETNATLHLTQAEYDKLFVPVDPPAPEEAASHMAISDRDRLREAGRLDPDDTSHPEEVGDTAADEELTSEDEEELDETDTDDAVDDEDETTDEDEESDEPPTPRTRKVTAKAKTTTRKRK